MNPQPIFFGITRSFWFTVVGGASLLFGAGNEVLLSIGAFADVLLGASEPTVGPFLVDVAPMVLWLLALNERKGAARPYTVDPRATA